MRKNLLILILHRNYIFYFVYLFSTTEPNKIIIIIRDEWFVQKNFKCLFTKIMMEERKEDDFNFFYSISPLFIIPNTKSLRPPFDKNES